MPWFYIFFMLQFVKLTRKLNNFKDECEKIKEPEAASCNNLKGSEHKCCYLKVRFKEETVFENFVDDKNETKYAYTYNSSCLAVPNEIIDKGKMSEFIGQKERDQEDEYTIMSLDCRCKALNLTSIFYIIFLYYFL